jgi:hypothetical protein
LPTETGFPVPGENLRTMLFALAVTLPGVAVFTRGHEFAAEQER